MSASEPTMPDLTRVKANVGRMIVARATEREIATYLGSEGVTVQDLQGARMSPEDEATYIELARDPRSTAASLQGFVRSRGFDITDAEAQAFIANRAREPQVAASVRYGEAPDSPAPPSPTPPPNTALESISATAGEFMDGLIPGSGKALAGAGGALGNTIAARFGMTSWDPSQAYSEEAAAYEQDQARLEIDHPQIASVADWLGFGSSFALPMARVAKGATWEAGVLNGAANGAGYGALSGALNDTGEGRLANAGRAALVGGVLGGAAAPVAQKAGDSVSAARRNIPGVNGFLTGVENLPRHITRKPLLEPSVAAHAQAERIINGELQDAVIATGMGRGTVPATPDTIATEVARRGALSVPAMPADVTDRLRDTAAWALQGQGTMATRARGELAARQAQAGSRIRGHVAQALGPIIDPVAEVDAIRRRASNASGPGYAAAYAQPMVVTPDIRAIMGTPAFQDALPQAVKNIRNAQRDPNALGFQLDPQGNISGLDTLSTEGFDQVVRAMRDSGRAAAEVNPITGRVTNNSNSLHINARAQDLQGALSAQNPAYRDVTANYADEMALRDALERGASIGKLSGPEIDAQRRAMPNHAQEGWMAGARTALADAATQASLKPAANVAQAVRQPLGLSGAGLASGSGDTAKLQAIEAVSGRPGVLSRLDDRLEGEDQAWRTFAAVRSPGHQTDAQDSLMDHAGTAVDVTRKLSQGRILGALSSVLLKGNPRGTLAFRGDVQDRMAELLTPTAPQDVRAAMGALSSRTRSDTALRGTIDRGAGNVAKVGILQAAGLSTDPLPPIDIADLEPQAVPDAADQAPLYRRRPF